MLRKCPGLALVKRKQILWKLNKWRAWKRATRNKNVIY